MHVAYVVSAIVMAGVAAPGAAADSLDQADPYHAQPEEPRDQRVWVAHGLVPWVVYVSRSPSYSNHFGAGPYSPSSVGTRAVSR